MWGCKAAGANVIAVPVYRWTLPDDRAPIRAAIKQIAGGETDVVIFTASVQVNNLIRVANENGLREGLLRGLASMVVASIGPVCTETLRAHHIAVDLEPAHSKLGHLIKEAASRSGEILARKRAGNRDTQLAPASRAALDSAQISAPVDVAATPSDSTAARDAIIREHPLLKACRREPAPYTPIWLMRQAGRYMPEYREVRARHSFLDICRQSDLAAEVTVTAVNRLGVDAAIIFADILLPLIPMQVGLRLRKGRRPRDRTAAAHRRRRAQRFHLWPLRNRSASWANRSGWRGARWAIARR